LKTRANGTLLTGLYIVGFIISGCFTAMCLTSFGQDKVSKLLFLGMTVLFEFGKGYMFFEFASNRHKGKMKNFFFMMWIGLLFFSLFASMGLAINESNKAGNDKIKNSTEYKMQNEQYDLHKGNIKNAQQELKSLQNIDEIIKNDETLKGLKQSKQDALNRNYITNETMGANHFQELISQREIKLRNDYAARKKELELLISNNQKGIEDNTNSVSKITTNGIKDTSGYKAVLGIISDFMNKTGIYLNSKWNTDQLEFLFYFLMSLMLELVICTMYFLKKYYEMIDSGEVKLEQPTKRELLQNDKNKENLAVSLDKSNLLKKNDIIANLEQKSENISKESNNKVGKIGFHYDVNDKGNDVIVRKENRIGFDYQSRDMKGIQEWQINYLKELYNKENYSKRFGAPGYTKLSTLINHDRNECSKFRATLATLGIVKTGENNTNELIIKEFKMALRKVSNSILKNGGM
jgi:hypothetical protein